MGAQALDDLRGVQAAEGFQRLGLPACALLHRRPHNGGLHLLDVPDDARDADEPQDEQDRDEPLRRQPRQSTQTLSSIKG